MDPEPIGICPNCGRRTGPTGDPCPGDVCHDKGYAFIPRPWYDAAVEFAAKKQRPLDPMLGRSLDRYLLAGKLGEGGMGAVYLARQRPLDREVALKVISGLEMTPATIARFEREARAISLLDHPNIVKLYDYGVGQLEFRVPYMALEYVRHGRTLRRALAQMRQETGAPIPGEVVRSIFAQVLHALQAAHAAGIVHRDMKPDNVMLAPVAGNPHFVKVLDFGLAKAVEDVSGFDGTVSRTGQFLGTPCYMAPEQASHQAQHDVDGRCDLYAVAVMVFEVFTGVRPFDGESALQVLARKVDPSYRPLDLPAAQGLPRPLRVFLERGMAADPGARFADAAHMLAALDDALSGRRTTAMGMAQGRPGSSGSSGSRPATPPSPVPAEGEDLETTLNVRRDRFGRAFAGGSGRVPASPGVPEATGDTFRQFGGAGGRRILWVLVTLLAAGLLVAGGWMATREDAGAGAQPATEAGPPDPAAPEPAAQAPAAPEPAAQTPSAPVPAAPVAVPAPVAQPSTAPAVPAAAPAPARAPDPAPAPVGKPAPKPVAKPPAKPKPAPIPAPVPAPKPKPAPKPEEAYPEP